MTTSRVLLTDMLGCRKLSRIHFLTSHVHNVMSQLMLPKAMHLCPLMSVSALHALKSLLLRAFHSSHKQQIDKYPTVSVLLRQVSALN